MRDEQGKIGKLKNLVGHLRQREQKGIMRITIIIDNELIKVWVGNSGDNAEGFYVKTFKSV